MKKLYLIPLSIIAASTLQSCWWPGPAGPQPYASKKANTEKFIKERDSQKDMPFTMRDQSINVPLISQKGQVNFSMNLIHGIGGRMTVGISSKVFLEAGGTFIKSEANENKTANFEVTESRYYSANNTSSALTYKSPIDYNLKTVIDGYSYFAGAGIYKNFGKNGRWENHGGFAYGSSKTDNTFSFDYDYYTFSYMPDYSFSEKRNYLQFYLQSDFGYSTRKTEGALYARTSWTHFTKQEFNYGSEVSPYEMTADQFVFQPGFQFAYGGTFRGFLQCGWNIPLGENQVKWFSTNVQFGVMYKIKDKARY